MKNETEMYVPVTYQISIVNFIFDKSTTEYVSRYQMRTDDGRLLESRQNISANHTLRTGGVLAKREFPKEILG